MLHSDDNFSTSFGDFDRDGWLDLYLGNRHAANDIAAGTNRLYRNTGNGHFVDITATANCAGNSLTLVATFMDFDEDGWPDLFEVSEKPTLMPNEPYRNNGDGTFTPVAALYGANMAIPGMGADFALLSGLTGFVGAVTSDVPTLPIARTTLVNAVAISIQ